MRFTRLRVKRLYSSYFLSCRRIFLIQLIFDVSSGRTEYIVGKAVLFAAYSGVWALILKPLMLLCVRVNTLLLKKNGKLPFDSQVELKFDEEFIYEKTSLTEIKMSYAKLERIAVGKTGVYLYHTVLSAFVIPNNVFANEAQRYDFLSVNPSEDKSTDRRNFIIPIAITHLRLNQPEAFL